jgi:tetratricopeptide (TPR) repeat protein
MAMGMELRDPMGGNRIRAAAFLVLAACAAASGQGSPQPSNQTSPPSNSAASQPSSSSRRSHHVQVADDDTPAQPAALSEAEAAIEKKDYAAAEPLLHKVVDHDAKSYVAWFDLGFVENELGNLDASIAAYRKSVSAKPDVFESNLNLGLQLAKTSQPDAEQFLRAATTLKPTAHVAEGQYRAWMALGDALQKSKPEEAVEAYRQAATLQPGEAEPHISAGALFEAGNKSADAEQEYKRALALNPQGSVAAIALANLYMRGRRFPEAEEYLRKISAENPQSSAAEIQLGRVLAAEGKNDDAIAAMAAGIQLNPADEAAKRELADLYATMGKNDLAEAAYRELLRAHPKDAELHDGLGRALLWQKKSAEAVRELEAALTLKPDLGNAYYDLAFAANDQKNYGLVIGALDRRGKLLPETPMTYFLRASAYDHLRDFKNAAANFHLFLKVANGKYPDQEWQAKHRLIAIEPKR